MSIYVIQFIKTLNIVSYVSVVAVGKLGSEKLVGYINTFTKLPLMSKRYNFACI
jgi:hypothetical protein